MSEPVRNLVSETFDGLDGSEVTFTGSACYESDGVDIPDNAGPMCPRCTHTVLETSGNDIVDWFVNTIQTINDDSCQLKDGDDIYEINYRVCPPAPSGQMAKCGDIDGRITGRVGFLNVNFAITTLQRDCVNGYLAESRNAIAFTDGCHTASGTNAIIAPLVEESVNYNDDVSDSNFEGQACFASYFAPLISGSDYMQINLPMVVMSFLSVLLTLCMHL